MRIVLLSVVGVDTVHIVIFRFNHVEHFAESGSVLKSVSYQGKTYLGDAVVRLTEWQTFPNDVFCLRALKIDDILFARSAVNRAIRFLGEHGVVFTFHLYLFKLVQQLVKLFNLHKKTNKV